MIFYRKFNLNDYDALYNFYNENISGIYRKISTLEFDNNLKNHPEFDINCVFLAEEDNKIIGFCMGHIRHIEANDESKPGYISTILVAKEYRLKGIGTKLVNMACCYLKEHGKKKVSFGYTSTLNWPWLIPNTDCFDHNGAPGASINSDLYCFLLKLGFDILSTQDAFCLELSKFKESNIVRETLDRLAKEGITIDLYDQNIHYGLEEFYLEINSEPFERVIRNNLLRDIPYPFAVISDHGRISGWTGAFYTEVSGRAHFDGIIIAPRMRKKGLGRALFSYLASYSFKNGSKFMSFFTDRTNFARSIYLSLGFKIIQSFAVMEKEI